MIRAFGKVYECPEFDEEVPAGALLFLSDARGIYIPQAFAEQVDRKHVANVPDWAWNAITSGPDEDSYWDAWVKVCDNAVLRSKVDGKAYAVYQDGDCWLIPLTEVAS